MTLLALWVTTFLVCVAGAIVPFVNTEIYLLSVAALSPPAFLLPLVLAATAGQMLGKVAMFYGGRGVGRIPSARVLRAVTALRARLEPRPAWAKVVLMSSASVGLPPLYVTAVACGTIGMGLPAFVLIGSAGRFVHFLAVAWLPHLVRAIAS